MEYRRPHARLRLFLRRDVTRYLQAAARGARLRQTKGVRPLLQNDAFYFSDPKPESRTESFGSARRAGAPLKPRSFVAGSGHGTARHGGAPNARLCFPCGRIPSAPRAVTAAPQRCPHDGRPAPLLAAAAARRLPGRPPGRAARRLPPPLRLLRPRRGALHLPLLHRRPSAHRSGRGAHQPGVRSGRRRASERVSFSALLCQVITESSQP